MAMHTEETADGLASSSMQHTVLLDAQVPTIALSMHRLYHIVVARSRISESRKANLALGLRQEQEEGELCEKIAGILAHGVPRARLAMSRECDGRDSSVDHRMQENFPPMDRRGSTAGGK